MPGHYHDTSHASANTGNKLGDRSSVRQSKLYRMYESGNEVKDLLGTGHLQWNTKKKQGVYNNHTLYDHNDPYNEVSATTGLAGLQELNESIERRTGGPTNRRGQAYGQVSSPSKIIRHEDKGYSAPGPLSSTSLSHTYDKKQTHREAGVKERRKNLGKTGEGENFSRLASKTSPKYGHSGGKKNTRYVKPPNVKRNVRLEYRLDTIDNATNNDKYSNNDGGMDSDVYGPRGTIDGLTQDLDNMDTDQLERLTLGLRQLKDMARHAEHAQRLEDSMTAERVRESMYSTDNSKQSREDAMRVGKIEALKSELAILQSIDKARGSPEKRGGALSPLSTARGQAAAGEYGGYEGMPNTDISKKNTPSPNQAGEGGRKLVPLRSSPHAPLLPALNTSLVQSDYNPHQGARAGQVTSRLDRKREEHMEGGIVNAMLRSPMRTYNNDDDYHNSHSPKNSDTDPPSGLMARGILKHSPARGKASYPTNPERMGNANRISPSSYNHHHTGSNGNGGSITARYAVRYDEYGNEMQTIPSKLAEPPREPINRGRPGVEQSPLKGGRRVVSDPRLQHPAPRDPYATDATQFFRMDFDTPRNSHSHDTYKKSPLHHPEMNLSHNTWKEQPSSNGNNISNNRNGMAMPPPLEMPSNPQYNAQYATDSSAYFRTDFNMPDKSWSHINYTHRSPSKATTNATNNNIGYADMEQPSPHRNVTDSSNYYNDSYSSPKESYSKSEFKPIPKHVLDLVPVSSNRPSEMKRSTRPW